MKIKKDDTVLVICGKDRGKTGKVEKVLSKKNKIVVSGVNKLKKHVRPSSKNPQGGIIQFNAPFDISNVMLLCSRCDRPTRVGYKILKDGTKQRICKKCKEAI